MNIKDINEDNKAVISVRMQNEHHMQKEFNLSGDNLAQGSRNASASSINFSQLRKKEFK